MEATAILFIVPKWPLLPWYDPFSHRILYIGNSHTFALFSISIDQFIIALLAHTDVAAFNVLTHVVG